MTKCEYCGKDAKCNVVMPIALGVFKAKLCIDCSLRIHEDGKMLLKIIRDRAKKLNITLPTSTEKMKKIIDRDDVK